MKLSDRDRYLGEATHASPSLYDPTVSTGERPRKRAESGARISAKTGTKPKGFSGALDANLPEQLSLFEGFESDLAHTSSVKWTRKRLNCD